MNKNTFIKYSFVVVCIVVFLIMVLIPSPFDRVSESVVEVEIEDALIDVEYSTDEEVKLSGKRLVACGDSITDASNPDGGYFKSYAEIVANKYDMTFFEDGVSGSTMAYNEGGKERISIRAFSNTRYMNLPTADYITIWFGWNDATYSTLGTIKDTDNTTFYGAYKTILDYLTTNYPDAKIGLVVPYGNSTVEPFQQAVRELSELYNIPCLDVTDFDRTIYTYDGTHPNQTGHEYLSEKYEKFILSL